MQIEAIFHLAAESDPDHRVAVLDQACGNDSELRGQVEALLSSDKGARSRVRAAIQSEHEDVAFPLTGKMVAHYRILGGMDAGGMGVVYRAEDINLGRPVAIKFLPAESAEDPAALCRFQREARSASALEHPNICPIYEFGEHEGQPFLAMQLLKGRTLRELIASAEPGKAPFDTRKLLDVAIQIADGLAAAHRHGIVHRDIKPANIFVTEQGEVKILDFGLAKFLQSDAEAADRVGNGAASDLFLTRTGAVIGTVAYIAPEQIRGERVDARSDLFSFGLVLYEMATGQRLAPGENPRNVRIPHRLEKIIHRAIANDPDNRYQTAAQIREELQVLRNSLARSSLPRWKAIAIAGALGIVVISAALWFILRRVPDEAVREFKQRQLTTNSSENPVTGGEISPDGKYLLYSDLNGIYLKPIAGGESRAITLPEVSTATKANWELASWLPDSTRFFAIAELPQKPSSLWNISITGRGHRKLAEATNPWGISPDGSRLAITKKHDRELWVMGANGEYPRKLYESGEGSHFRTVQWSPDGKRLAYIKINARSEAQIELGDPEGGQPTVLVSRAAAREISSLEDGFRDMNWLADGRLIYVGGEQYIHGMSCNLFEARIDSRSGRVLGKPHQITNWAGFCVTTLSGTADGKKLAFNRSSDSLIVYVADFDSARLRLSPPRRLTFTDDLSSPTGWTRDSTAAFVRSNREGSWGIYKQPISGGASKAIATGFADVSWTTPVTPDGKWLLYGARDSSHPDTRWMRLPLSGGSSEQIATGDGAVLCPHRSTGLCVAAERTTNGKGLVFKALDPLKGVGQELARFNDEHANEFGLDLSFDGSRIVLFRPFDNRLRLLSLRGDSALTELRIKGNVHVRTISWAPNGKGWFASNQTQEGADLLYVDQRGNTRRLWHVDGYNVFLWGRPSPDGRHLAIQGSAGNSNMWMIEDF